MAEHTDDAKLRMLDIFADLSSASMYVADFFTGELLMCNRHFATFFRLDKEHLNFIRCWEMIEGSEDGFCDFCPRQQLLDEAGRPNGKVVTSERENHYLNLWIRCTWQAVEWKDGQLAMMVVILDITEERRIRQELLELAFYDQAMHLPNLHRLENDLEENAPASFYLVGFDIISLRRINDAYGFRVGDLLLQAIADWIRECGLRQARTYRLEGDTFCVLVNREDSLACGFAGLLFERFRLPWNLSLGTEEIAVYCSASVCVIGSEEIHSIETGGLMNLIERTLAVSRETGNIAVYNKDLDASIKESLIMEMDLKNCVESGMTGFDVHFQPIIDPAEGTWRGLEALCRWESNVYGQVSPLTFIPMAERTRLIGAIGCYVLDRAVALCSKWNLTERKGFLLDVNLSPLQLADESLVSQVLGILRKYDFPGSALVLEITESSELTLEPRRLEAVERLRAVGIAVAMDDFGTGYSNFNNLKDLPVSILKTERQFIENIENDDYLQYLFYLLVELAHAADMKLIAEGVETKDQMKVLMKNGADLFQGFLFSRPLTEEELSGKLHHFFKTDAVFQRSGMLPQKLEPGRLLHHEKGTRNIPSSLFKTLSHCFHILLTEPDTERAISSTLRIVGEKFDVSRCMIFVRKESDLYDNTHEWCATLETPHKEYMQQMDLARVLPGWVAAFQEDEVVIVPDVGQMEELSTPHLQARRIRSLIAVPIRSEAHFIGFLCLTDAMKSRDWLPEEISLLHSLCLIMGSILQKDLLEQEVFLHNRILTGILNHMNLALYVSDLDTCEILFANRAMQEQYGQQLEGKMCHEVLQDRRDACSNCRLDELKEGLKKKWSDLLLSRSCFNPETGRELETYDAVIPWIDGKPAHLRYSIDVTGIGRSENRTSPEGPVFGGVISRANLVLALEGILCAAQASEQTSSVVLLDLTELKPADRRSGHRADDQPVEDVIRLLWLRLRAGDLIGDYGKNTLLVILPGCSVAEAEQKARELAALLRQQFASDAGTCRIPYGVADSSGVYEGEPAVSVEDLAFRMLNRAGLQLNSRITEMSRPSGASGMAESPQNNDDRSQNEQLE